MKKFIFLVLAGVIFSGCASSYIKVLDRKGPTMPLTNILTVYVNEACNFSLADSTGYNICLRTSFDDAGNVAARGKVEKSISSTLATKGTAVYSAADLLGVNNSGSSPDNSYGSFKTLMETLHIDGVLVVQLHDLQKERYTRQVGGTPVAGKYGTSSYTPESTVSGELDNASFYCYLLKPNDLNNPVWRAALQTKGASTQRDLDRSMTHALVKSLIDGGYIVH